MLSSQGCNFTSTLPRAYIPRHNNNRHLTGDELEHNIGNIGVGVLIADIPPYSLVVVPVLSSGKITFTPISVSLLEASVIVPLKVTCSWAKENEIPKRRNKHNFKKLFILFFIKNKSNFTVIDKKK